MRDTAHIPERLWPRTYRGRRMPEACVPGLVSVIIPTYNRDCLLIEAMECVRAQTYRPIELIVADDGSTNDTAGLVEGWREGAEGDGFAVRYLRQENGGCCSARNLGLVESRGEFIQHLDSDDLLAPGRLASLVEVARQAPDFQFAVTAYDILDADGSRAATIVPPDFTAWNRTARCIAKPFWTASAFFARDFLRTVGLFRADLDQGGDWEYGIRMALSCEPARCRIVPEPSASYRMHGGPRILTGRRTVERTKRNIREASALLKAADPDGEYAGLWVNTLFGWYVLDGTYNPEYLRFALEQPCARTLKAKVRALLLLTRLFGGARVIRWWRGHLRRTGRAAFDAEIEEALAVWSRVLRPGEGGGRG